MTNNKGRTFSKNTFSLSTPDIFYFPRFLTWLLTTYNLQHVPLNYWEAFQRQIYAASKPVMINIINCDTNEYKNINLLLST
jgi:hypothetical protein